MATLCSARLWTHRQKFHPATGRTTTKEWCQVKVFKTPETTGGGICMVFRLWTVTWSSKRLLICQPDGRTLLGSALDPLSKNPLRHGANHHKRDTAIYIYIYIYNPSLLSPCGGPYIYIYIFLYISYIIPYTWCGQPLRANCTST